MTEPTTPKYRRILVVDDNQAIHADFQKILGGKGDNPASSQVLLSAPSGGRP